MMNKKSFIFLILLVLVKIVTCQINPSFVFSFPHGNCAPNVDVVFSNTTPNASEYTFWWYFDNGSPEFKSNELTRQINYSLAKKYIVSLKAVDAAGNSEIFYDTIVLVKSPIAAFKDSAEGCVPTTLHLQNTTIIGDAPIVEYKWNFGDGKYIYDEYPTKYITQAATYPVYLNVTDENNCQSVVSSNVQVYNKPSADFVLSKFLMRCTACCKCHKYCIKPR
ncbi:MAG: PKD domain-containing protein [Bacteroidales bacterium]|nr:PKD domain-containing protein [Bacteroidales bacterium]